MSFFMFEICKSSNISKLCNLLSLRIDNYIISTKISRDSKTLSSIIYAQPHGIFFDKGENLFISNRILIPYNQKSLFIADKLIKVFTKE